MVQSADASANQLDGSPRDGGDGQTECLSPSCILTSIMATWKGWSGDLKLEFYPRRIISISSSAKPWKVSESRRELTGLSQPLAANSVCQAQSHLALFGLFRVLKRGFV